MAWRRLFLLAVVVAVGCSDSSKPAAEPTTTAATTSAAPTSTVAEPQPGPRFVVTPSTAAPGDSVTLSGTACPPDPKWADIAGSGFFVVVGAGGEGHVRGASTHPPADEPGHVSFELVPEFNDLRVADATPDVDGNWSTTWDLPPATPGGETLMSALCIGGTGLESGFVHYGGATFIVENVPTHPGVGTCLGTVLAEADHYVVMEDIYRETAVDTVLCDTTTGETLRLSSYGRSISCDDDGVVLTEFVLPSESIRDLDVPWTASRDGVEFERGSFHLRDDYEAVAEMATSSCGGWRSVPPVRVAPLVLTTLFDELGFTDVGGDHAIDPTWAAVGSHDGQQYEVHIDLDYQDTYDVPGDWIRHCEVGLLAFSPEPSPALLAELLDLAGCEG